MCIRRHTCYLINERKALHYDYTNTVMSMIFSRIISEELEAVKSRYYNIKPTKR